MESIAPPEAVIRRQYHPAGVFGGMRNVTYPVSAMPLTNSCHEAT